MRKIYRIISAVLLLSFLLNTTIYDTHACPDIPICSISKPTVTDELAVGSMCNGILGLVNKDKGDLMLALQTSLMHFARGKGTIDPDKLLERAGEYRGSIFSKKHFFFSEKTDLSDSWTKVKCRVRDDKKYKDKNILPLRTYHAVFSTERDSLSGFDVEIYTENEWEKEFSVTPKGTEVVKAYVKHDKTIDRFIFERIKEGNFTEITGRAKKLGWDEEYPYRIKPKKYLAERLWDYIKEEGLDALLKGFGTSAEEALEGKNIVFIRVPSDVNLPVIYEAGRKINVTTHASQNALYLFLDKKVFNKLYSLPVKKSLDKGKVWDEYLKIRETIRRKVIKRLLHAVGKARNFEIFYDTEKRKIQNVLDAAWGKFLETEEEFLNDMDSGDEIIKGLSKAFEKPAKILMENYPDLKKLRGGQVDLDLNLAGRAFGGGFLSEKLRDNIPFYSARRKAKIKENAERFMGKIEDFTTDELKRLADAYGDQQLYKTALALFRREAKGEEYKKFQEVFVKLRKTLEEMKINVKVISQRDFRPEIDKIGGVETLKEALNLRNEMERLLDETTWDKTKKTAAFKPLPDVELKTAALLRGDLFEMMLTIAFGELEASLREKIFYSVIFPTKAGTKECEEAKRNYRNVEKCLSFDEKFSMAVGATLQKVLNALIEKNTKTVKNEYSDNEFNILGIEYNFERSVFFVPCSAKRKQNKQKYYAMVDFRNKNKIGVHILSPEEKSLADKLKQYGILDYIGRPAEDMNIFYEYFWHENNIDSLVKDAFARGKTFIIPEKSELLISAKIKLMVAFNKVTNKVGEKYMKLVESVIKRPYVLINAGDKVNFPKVKILIEVDGKNKEKKEAVVRMHTGPKGKYIFLTDEEYRSFHKYGDKVLEEKIENKIKGWIIHDAGGVGLGLPMIGVGEDGDVMNELDYAYQGLDFREEPMLKKILESDNPIVDINNLRGKNAAGKEYTRDYLAGNIWENIEKNDNISELKTLLKIFNVGNLGDVKGLYSAEEKAVISKIRPNGGVKLIQQELNHRQDPLTVEEKIKERIRDISTKKEMKTIAEQTGMLSAPPEANFTLFVLNDFVSGSRKDINSEYGKDIIDYGSRFGIEKISTDKPGKIVSSILLGIKEQGLEPRNVVVQLPKIFAEEKEKYVSEIKRLREKATGIRFMIVDTAGIKQEEAPRTRKKYRSRIYSIMRLVGKMGRCAEASDDVQVMEFLKYLMSSFLKNPENKIVQVEEYITALETDNILDMIGIILSCMPVKPLPDPNYDENVKIFTFA